MGSSRSGGQRQRVLLARALYRLPTMLILEEASSHLDLQREAQVGRAIAGMREGQASRLDEPLPLEVQPLVVELNGLLEHSERQAEESRTHAGNLAHALKTPLTVVMNAATAKAEDLADTLFGDGASVESLYDSQAALAARRRLRRRWRLHRGSTTPFSARRRRPRAACARSSIAVTRSTTSSQCGRAAGEAVAANARASRRISRNCARENTVMPFSFARWLYSALLAKSAIPICTMFFPGRPA
jgi:hypothetical protein